MLHIKGANHKKLSSDRIRGYGMILFFGMFERIVEERAKRDEHSVTMHLNDACGPDTLQVWVVHIKM